MRREEPPPCHRKSPDHSEKGPTYETTCSGAHISGSTPQRPSPGTETHHSSFRLRWHSRVHGHLASERPGKGGLGSGIATHRLPQLFLHIPNTQPPMENLCADQSSLCFRPALHTCGLVFKWTGIACWRVNRISHLTGMELSTRSSPFLPGHLCTSS